MRGFLGIDVGTQGLSIVLTEENMRLIETGCGNYTMVPNLGLDCFEQNPNHWVAALSEAMIDLRNRIQKISLTFDDEDGAAIERVTICGIGISGQMHGEVLVDHDGNAIGNARIWCDGRNEREGNELTDLLGVKCPKRMTICRWLWTVRNSSSELLQRVSAITTPAGWIGFKLTGCLNLGIGDASGIFPVNSQTKAYDVEKLEKFDSLITLEFNSAPPIKPIINYLPNILVAGEIAGDLSPSGSLLLGLKPGILVAPPEGDQPAALAGSLIGVPGQVSMSFGTSIVSNSVCNQAFVGISPSVDHFLAVDGKPINMVWLRNGTSSLNVIVEMFGNSYDCFRQTLPGNSGNYYEYVISHIVVAP